MASVQNELDSAAAVCAACPQLDGGSCLLRGVPIAQPDFTSCASHPAHGSLRRPLPIGPVIALRGGGLRGEGLRGEGPELLFEAPDTPRVRDALIDLIADIHPRGTEPLSLRQATIVWQLKRLKERRAIVHIDRLEATQMINASRATGSDTLPLDRLFAVLPAAARGGSLDTSDFLMQFTIAGRLLLVSSALIGCAVFAAVLALEVGLALGVGAVASILHFGILTGVSVGAAALWLRAGIFVFDRLRIPFRRTPDTRPE